MKKKRSGRLGGISITIISESSQYGPHPPRPTNFELAPSHGLFMVSLLLRLPSSLPHLAWRAKNKRIRRLLSGAVLRPRLPDEEGRRFEQLSLPHLLLRRWQGRCQGGAAPEEAALEGGGVPGGLGGRGVQASQDSHQERQEEGR